jgi:hypothetical protein
MVDDPLGITEASWDLGPKRLSATTWDSTWWAPEFYRRDAGPLLELPNQTGFFRRDRGVLLAAAAAWTTSDFTPGPRKALFGAVMASGPHSSINIATDTIPEGTVGSLLIALKPEPQILGLEMVSADGVAGAARRARFGISPPRPLGAAEQPTLALSDPILILADAATAPHLGLGDAVPNMLPSTELQKPGRVGIFWEMYGLNPGDTVRMSLRVVRSDSPGIGGRFLAAIGMGRTADSLTVGWMLGSEAADFSATGGTATVRPAAISVDLSAFSAGHYELQILLEKPGATPISTSRELDIIK